MKNKFFSRFDSDNLRKTIIYFLIAVSLIGISLLVGLTDNFLTITILFIGIVLFLYTVLHLLEKSAYYGILAAVCLVILILDFIWPFISEGIAMTVGLICFAGIIAGIIGMLRFRKYD